MEKTLQILAAAALLVLALVLVMLAPSQAAPGTQALPPAPALPAYQLLINPGMEVYDPPYGQFDGVDCQVATGWQRFWYGGPAPCWMDTRVFADSHLGVGWVDRIEGETSQLLVSTEPYTAGLWQQVTGLTPGVGYGFHAAMLTIYQTSAPPAVDGTMIKEVGLDPTGGTDPQAPAVVWSEADGHDEAWSIDLRAAAYAEAPTITVFIRVTSPYSAGPPPFLNLSFLDSAILAQTPVVTATSPAFSMVPTFVVRWDNAVAAPGARRLRWYDVQWLDEAEGAWHDWITETQELSASFTGERGHAYRFRARVFQKYVNGAHLYSPYRPGGDTRTVVKGPKLAGLVLTHEGVPLGEAKVVVSGTAYIATTGHDGQYDLDVLAWSEPQIVTVSHPALLAPAPVFGVTFGPTETVFLTWTLRPPDDTMVNGGFEAGLGGWSSSAAQGVSPTVVTEPVHTGYGALALGNTAPVSLTVGVSQTLVVTNAWEPALSLWYYPVTDDDDDVLNVVLTVVTRSLSATLPVTMTQRFTPPLDTGGWSHRWYAAGPPDAYLTGTVTIGFQVWDDGDGMTTTVYLDEVSLGATMGGPYKCYLPLVRR